MAEAKNPEDTQKLVQQMRQWLNSQPHLPKDVDDKLLLRFVHSCYYDLEKAKTAADLFFTIRGSSPELITNRDPQAPHMKKTLGILNLAQLKVSGGRNLWIWQLNDPGLENYDYLHDAKVFLMSTDAWLLEVTELEEADIVLMDSKDISLKFITKFDMSIARKISKYQEDAMPIRLKEIHIVNAPPFIHKLFALMKPFLKQEITDMVHFHVPKSETLYQHLDKADLPQDFGGTNGLMAEHMKDVMRVIMKQREHLLNPNLWAATPTDKKSKSKKKSPEESPAFRNLAID